MNLNPNQYRSSLDKMRQQLLDHRGLPHRRCVELAAVSGVPALAVVLYANRADVMGPSEELTRAAQGLHKFYKYEIVNQWEDLCT